MGWLTLDQDWMHAWNHHCEAAHPLASCYWSCPRPHSCFHRTLRCIHLWAGLLYAFEGEESGPCRRVVCCKGSYNGDCTAPLQLSEATADPDRVDCSELRLDTLERPSDMRARRDRSKGNSSQIQPVFLFRNTLMTSLVGQPKRTVLPRRLQGCILLIMVCLLGLGCP